jgi:hypothetical protein
MCTTAHDFVQLGFILLSSGAHIVQASMRSTLSIAERGSENARCTKLWEKADRIEHYGDAWWALFGMDIDNCSCRQL